MSRLARRPIEIPKGVEASMHDGTFSVKGPKGELSRTLRPEVVLTIGGSTASFKPVRENKQSAALWGTYASHLKNMIAGVNNPYQKKLILEGVGYKSEVKGANLSLALGFSHPVNVLIPQGLTVTAEKNVITISGIDKELLGQFAASVRALKKPEPYKGKGFRYEGEVIRRKQGKKSV